jgi:hypothetical protein
MVVVVVVVMPEICAPVCARLSAAQKVLVSPGMPEHQMLWGEGEITENKRVANPYLICRTLVSGCHY